MNRPKIWATIICGLLVLFAGCVLAQDAQTSKKRASKSAAAKKTSSKTKKELKKEQSAKDADASAQKEKKAPEQQVKKGPDKGTYTVRLRDLEERVNRLKEQIFRSKARLSLLAETVLEKKIAGAQASISFRNEMGGSYRLHKATLLLDGGPIYGKTDEGGNLSKRQEIDLFDGPITPGDHTLNVVLEYKGHGYGIFSYLKGYAFKIRSNYTFTVNEGKTIQLEVIGYEKGGATTPLEDRPAVRYVEEFSDFDTQDAAMGNPEANP